MPTDEPEFDNVTQETEQRIRNAVDHFKAKWKTENWNGQVHGIQETPNFKVSITAPDNNNIRLLVPNTLDAGEYICRALETEHKNWQIRTSPV